MLRMFFSILSQGLAGAAVVSVLGGTLNTLLGWNLSLSVAGSSTPLPRDAVSVVAVSALLGLLAGLAAVVADPARSFGWLRAHPRQAAGFSLLVLGALAIGLFQVTGGGLGSALRSGDHQKIRAYLEKHQVAPELLRKHLYQALKGGQLTVAEAILENFADLNQTAGEHQTTLLADGVVFFPKDSVLLLLGQGADPKISDRFRRTPALRLVLYRLPNFSAEGEAGMVELLQALEKSGCDLKQPAEDGETPLKAAQARGLKQVAGFLEGH